jgi:hypothetical protein
LESDVKVRGGLAIAFLVVALAVSGAPSALAQVNRESRFGIAEGHKNQISKSLSIGWERLTFPWDAVQPNSPAEWRADFAFTPQMLQTELDTGVQVVGLLQFTPDWAQANPSAGKRSLPKNLDLPWDSTDNYWGQFTRRMAQHYAGRINYWVIWNEPEIRSEDPGGGSSWTFAGGPAEYYKLLKVAYKNIKAGNPNAKVIFAGTAYWLDRNQGRDQYLKRVLDVAAQDPEAKANGYFFDVASFNLYGVPDGLYRVHFEMKEYLRGHGLESKPLWITETNAMPYDPQVPCAERYHPSRNPDSQTLDNQANFTIQSLAMAAAAGWERIEWYQLTDSGTCSESAIWGLVRDDGSQRPAFAAFKTAVNYFSGASKVTFKPLDRWEEPYSPWPRDRGSIHPNWQVSQVVFERGAQRVHALWSGIGEPQRVRIPFQGSAAKLVDRAGAERPLTPNQGWLVVDLEPANARGPLDPPGYYYIGGAPLLVVQDGVPAEAPVLEPRLGDAGSASPGFRIAVSPDALVVNPGQTVTFALRAQGVEGFSEPLGFRLVSYSTQRFPDPVESTPPSIQPILPPSLTLGHPNSMSIQVNPDAEAGIHFFTIEASGGGVSNTFDVVVQVER